MGEWAEIQRITGGRQRKPGLVPSELERFGRISLATPESRETRGQEQDQGSVKLHLSMIDSAGVVHAVI